MAAPYAKAVSPKLQQIAEWAQQQPEQVFISLAHLIDLDLLREAYRQVRKDGAPGIDGVTAKDYGRHLDEKLLDLRERFLSGSYWAPPAKRVHIPKDSGGTRALGLPTFEDKILQRAVSMVLTLLYEPLFSERSYGSRPGRSAHQALGALRGELQDNMGGWVLDLDIQAFFDHLDHSQLREFLSLRVRDGVLRRTIDKWLKAGVLENGEVYCPDTGTPQGGVISPLLANVYLHYVIDRWFHEEILPRLRGRAFLVRYVDDVVMVFQNDHDAKRVLEALPKRLARFGLTAHPTKTRLLRFRPGKRTSPNDSKDDEPPTGTFNFLGFTHHWALSRKRKWVVKRRTMSSRVSRTLRAIATWCRRHRHWPIDEQHAHLSAKLRGHYTYYGIPGNSAMLSRVKWHTERIWKRWLDRRSQRGRMRWEVFLRLLQRWPLPEGRVRPVA